MRLRQTRAQIWNEPCEIRKSSANPVAQQENLKTRGSAKTGDKTARTQQTLEQAKRTPAGDPPY